MSVPKVLSISFLVNLMLSIIKIVIGFIGRSSSLIADGLHSFSDLFTDIVGIIGSKLSSKPADKKHPYGHGKLEYIISIIISIVILGLGFSIIYESINKKPIVPNYIVIIACLITIIFKILLSRYLFKKGKDLNSNILISSSRESKADVLSSLVVLISSVLMQLSKYINVFIYADIVACIIVGILIVRLAFNLLKNNISMILGEQETDPEFINKVEKIILDSELIRRIDTLVLLKYGSYYKLISEVSMDEDLSLKEAHFIVDEIEKKIKLKQPLVHYTTIHINPYEGIDN